MNVIKLSGKVTAEALLELCEGRAHVIRVANFVGDEICDEISTRSLRSALHGSYENAPLIHRVGHAFFESTSTAAALDYLDQSTNWIQTIRNECAPYVLPMDLLRLHLDEVWPGSAQLARLAGRPMFVGLIRNFRAGSGAEPHQDHLEWDTAAAGIEDYLYFESQLAANVYLKIPPSGGELVIWPTSLSKQEYDDARKPASYGVREELLRGTPLVIAPRKGELIIFNCRLTHMVRSSPEGDRVASSNFMGFNGLYRPLALWS